MECTCLSTAFWYDQKDGRESKLPKWTRCDDEGADGTGSATEAEEEEDASAALLDTDAGSKLLSSKKKLHRWASGCGAAEGSCSVDC
jgi:hypothetical protein